MPQITVKIAQETLCGGIAANTQSWSKGPFLFCIRLKKGGSIKEIMVISIEPMISCALCSDELQVSFQLFFNSSVIGRATLFLYNIIGVQK